jgi:hypothetical protein
MFNDKAKLVYTNTLGEDVGVDEIINSPDSPLSILFKKAESLNKNKLKKSYIEASLFCEKDLSKIVKILEIDLELLKVYQTFFFDTENLDRLSKIEHLESLEDKNESLLKLWSLTHGINFIAWRLGYKVSISPVEGLVDLFSTCIYKSKEANFNASNSDTSKESLKWTKQSADIARLLKLWVMDNDEARKDLELALKEVVPEFEGLDKILTENGFDLTELEELNASIALTESLANLNSQND